MKNLMVLCFLFAVTVIPRFDMAGKLSALYICVPCAALNGERVTVVITPQDIPLELDADGDLKNKAAVRAVVKQKYQNIVNAKLAEQLARTAKRQRDNAAAEKLNLPLTESDFN